MTQATVGPRGWAFLVISCAVFLAITCSRKDRIDAADDQAQSKPAQHSGFTNPTTTPEPKRFGVDLAQIGPLPSTNPAKVALPDWAPQTSELDRLIRHGAESRIIPNATSNAAPEVATWINQDAKGSNALNDSLAPVSRDPAAELPFRASPWEHQEQQALNSGSSQSPERIHPTDALATAQVEWPDTKVTPQHWANGQRAFDQAPVSPPRARSAIVAPTRGSLVGNSLSSEGQRHAPGRNVPRSAKIELDATSSKTNRQRKFVYQPGFQP